MPQPKNTYHKSERVKSRKLIDALFRQGKSLTVFPLKLVWMYNEAAAAEPLQAGVSVSKRHFKKAVDRNRVKRLMREAYRVQKHELKACIKEAKHLALFFIYLDKELPTLELTTTKMQLALKRLIKQINEDASTNT